MADIIYSESAYRFTNPIRYFKANDPYYWEVDNIPLKQLQENNLWLKDQLAGGSIKLENIQRDSLDELRPVVTETNRRVTVHRGRYTARVNDAYHIQPLASIRQALNTTNFVPYNSDFRFLVPQKGGGDGTQDHTMFTADELANILARAKSIVAQDALHLNGLAERAFSRPMMNSQEAGDWNTGSDYNYGFGTTVTDQVGFHDPIMPVLQAKLWKHLADAPQGNHTPEGKYSVYNWQNEEDHGYLYLNLLENLFIKRWRGVARTAVVDVPDNLTIDIPEFSTDEFFYYDENNNKQIMSGVENRIDLLFIYSKPVDTSGVCITHGGEKTTITEATLGLVKGAGLGLNFNKNSVTDLAIDAFDADGNLLTLPSVADQKRTDNGFKNITQYTGTDSTQKFSAHGSFPAPDDVVNLAPLLANKLESTEWDLVGQSILPIAYIVSTSDSDLIRTRDVIDIRPFFRTAELAYNERAGIAAATPPLSLANPAVGEREVERREARIMSRVGDRLDDTDFHIQQLTDRLPMEQPVLQARLLRIGNTPGPVTSQWTNNTTSSMSWTQDTRGLGYKGCFIRGATTINNFNFGNLVPLAGLPAITVYNHTGYFDDRRQDDFAFENWYGLPSLGSTERTALTTDTLALLGPGLWEIDVTLNVMSSRDGNPKGADSNRGDLVKLVLWDYGNNTFIDRPFLSQYADAEGYAESRSCFTQRLLLPVTMSDLQNADNPADRYFQLGVGIECPVQNGSDAHFSLDGNLVIKRLSNTDGSLGQPDDVRNVTTQSTGSTTAEGSNERRLYETTVGSASLL